MGGRRRRGRGEEVFGGDEERAVQAEVEDIDVLVELVGGEEEGVAFDFLVGGGVAVGGDPAGGGYLEPGGERGRGRRRGGGVGSHLLYSEIMEYMILDDNNDNVK